MRTQLGLRDLLTAVLADAGDRRPLRLQEALIQFTAGAEDGTAARIAVHATPRVDGDRADAVLAAVCLLEAADLADASVHGLVPSAPAPANGGNGSAPTRRFTPAGSSAQGNTAAALAGAWLRARATELVADLGAGPLDELTRELPAMAAGWRREGQDLYDAGRTPQRCLDTASQRLGGLCSLAAVLGDLSEQRTGRLDALRAFGRSLGTATRILGDTAALRGDRSPGAHPLQRGVYGLAVACALEAEPKLAEKLGGAVPDDAVGGIVAEIDRAGGFRGVAERAAGLAEEARAALEPLDGVDGLAALAAAAAAEAREVERA